MFLLTLAATAYIKNNLAEVEITERERGGKAGRESDKWEDGARETEKCGYVAMQMGNTKA